MTDVELRRALQTEALPGELEAGRRTWTVVRRAYEEREPARPGAARARPLLALAFAAALVAAALSPAGRAVGDWVRDQVRGEDPARPALVRVPGGGRLLVVSEAGPWVVQRDGTKRLLGTYENASWSPQGLFVVATRGRRVLALEPDGDPRWTLTRSGMVAQARWAPSGFRIAYREGAALRVVAGDGSDDRLLARGVAPVAAAWRPEAAEHVLAFADERGRVHVVDVDSGRELWRARAGAVPRQLAWSGDGSRLLAVGAEGEHRLLGGRGRTVRTLRGPYVRAAFAPGGRSLALLAATRAGGSRIVLYEDVARGRARTLFAGAGRFEDVAWSPGGDWILATWPSADQWLFLPLPDVSRVVAVSAVTREFDPGTVGSGRFPRVAGWCCPSGAD